MATKDKDQVSRDSVAYKRKKIGSTLTGPLTPEEERQYREWSSQGNVAFTRRKIGSTQTGPLTPKEQKQYQDLLSRDAVAYKRKNIGSTQTGPLTPEEQEQYQEWVSREKKKVETAISGPLAPEQERRYRDRVSGGKKKVEAFAISGPFTPEQERWYDDWSSQMHTAHVRGRIGSAKTGPLTPEEEQQYKDYLSRTKGKTPAEKVKSIADKSKQIGPTLPEEQKQYREEVSGEKKKVGGPNVEKTPVEKAKNVTDKVKKKMKPTTTEGNVERIFRENFEEPMAKRMKEWNFNSQGSEGKAGPLPRSPESIGLPKIPKSPESIGLPKIPKSPESIGLPKIPKSPEALGLPPIPKAKPLVPPPPAAISGSANVVPQADPLAKFRPSSSGAMTGGPGAAAWDNAWEPSTPMYHQDAMEAEYEPRRAQDMERGDWLAGQSTDQLKQNLDLMSRNQGRPELRNIDAIEWFKKLQQGQR